jgi:hypothetical protein
MIVERHGGQLLASSVKGSGAQLQIILPIKMRPDVATN